MTVVFWNRLHAATHPHPSRCVCTHTVSNVRLGTNPGRHCEFERRATAVAGSDPDPAAERPLDHEAAEIKAEPQAALRAAAPGRPCLVEDGPHVGRRQSLPAVGDPDLEPFFL